MTNCFRAAHAGDGFTVVGAMRHPRESLSCSAAIQELDEVLAALRLLGPSGELVGTPASISRVVAVYKILCSNFRRPLEERPHLVEKMVSAEGIEPSTY